MEVGDAAESPVPCALSPRGKTRVPIPERQRAPTPWSSAHTTWPRWAEPVFPRPAPCLHRGAPVTGFPGTVPGVFSTCRGDQASEVRCFIPCGSVSWGGLGLAHFASHIDNASRFPSTARVLPAQAGVSPRPPALRRTGSSAPRTGGVNPPNKAVRVTPLRGCVRERTVLFWLRGLREGTCDQPC